MRREEEMFGNYNHGGEKFLSLNFHPDLSDANNSVEKIDIFGQIFFFHGDTRNL